MAPSPFCATGRKDPAPVEGERVMTSAAAGAFPAGLPLGTVHYNADHVPQVYPDADLDHLSIVRLFDYGDTGVVAPEAPAGRQQLEAR